MTPARESPPLPSWSSAPYIASTHHVHRGPESLPCYCAATMDHQIGHEAARMVGMVPADHCDGDTDDAAIIYALEDTERGEHGLWVEWADYDNLRKKLAALPTPPTPPPASADTIRALPELPRPEWVDRCRGDAPFFSADQMRAYAQTALANPAPTVRGDNWNEREAVAYRKGYADGMKGAAQKAADAEPAAWIYERCESGEPYADPHSQWYVETDEDKPDDEPWYRNARPLYLAPPAATPAQAGVDEAMVERAVQAFWTKFKGTRRMKMDRQRMHAALTAALTTGESHER